MGSNDQLIKTIPYWKNAPPDVLDIFLHHMEDVVTLVELNSNHIPVILTVKCSMSAQVRPDPATFGGTSIDVYLKGLSDLSLAWES